MPDKPEVVSDAEMTPTPTGVPRDAGGRWLAGHGSPGPGNPHFRALSMWRAVLAESVTRDDVAAVLVKLVEAARAGERWAVGELLDRTLGKPVQHTVLESDEAGPRYKILIGIDEGQL